MYLSGDDSGFFWSVLALAPVGLQEQIVKYLGFFFFLADLTGWLDFSGDKSLLLRKCFLTVMYLCILVPGKHETY